MIQETTTRKRSSGSTSKRKKSQRLKINQPKPPRLILHPPKPPHQKPTKLKMVLRPPPKSPSPEVDHSPPRWKETTILGNGEDASYDYGDICKVQSIMKVFNGTLSATRKVESNEKKLNKDPLLSSGVTTIKTDTVTENMRAKMEMVIYFVCY